MFSESTKDVLRPYIPTPILAAKKQIVTLKRDLPLLRLKYIPRQNSSFAERSNLVQRIRESHKGIACPHTHEQIEQIVTTLLRIPPAVEGCVVEAGCYKGGSTAKLSLATRLVKRKLFVFDSFAGLPDNQEEHDRTLSGEKINFSKGSYTGTLEEVKENVRQFGDISVCEFVPGWFEDTMPHFRETIALAFIDVDLASSTRTCLRSLYPLLVPGGSIFSHDGDVPLCIQTMRDETFWLNEVGAPRPHIPGLGQRKLVQIRKRG